MYLITFTIDGEEHYNSFEKTKAAAIRKAKKLSTRWAKTTVYRCKRVTGSVIEVRWD